MKSSLPLVDPNAGSDSSSNQPVSWVPMIQRFDDRSLATTFDRWISVELADLEARLSQFAKRSVPRGR